MSLLSVVGAWSQSDMDTEVQLHKLWSPDLLKGLRHVVFLPAFLGFHMLVLSPGPAHPAAQPIHSGICSVMFLPV
jgi:hypothetical protein